MLDNVPTSGALRFDVDLAYRDAVGVDSLRRVTVQRLELDSSPESFSGICHARRAFRQFRVDRVAQLVDPATGEAPHDLVAWLLERASGPQNGILPRPGARSQTRRVISPVRFEGGLAKGWAFGVAAAFKSALDISLGRRLLTARAPITRQIKARGISVDPDNLLGSESARFFFMEQIIAAGIPATRIEVVNEEGQPPKPAIWIEMQGAPPLFDFSAGDIFYSPPCPRPQSWSDQLQSLRYLIQVKNEELGYVEVEVRRYADGQWIGTKRCELDQADLAAILQLGIGEATQAILPENDFKPVPETGLS